jgi:chromosome segregation ATPase
MKNFQQNLLIVLALSLCGLCVFQWRGQTAQRIQIEKLSQTVYEKSAAIRDCTNSIQTMDRQIAQMDARLSEMKTVLKTNDDLMAGQKREINRLLIAGEGVTNEIVEYKKAVDTLEGKLKEAYDGIKKQNDAIKEIVAQRDEIVKKLNDSVKDRNEVVAKYNALVDQVNKQQKASAKE